jgi:hypothetical protein
VDNRVHAADRIYLLCYAVDLGCAAQVTDYDPGGLGCEVGKRRGALGRSCMKDDLMAVIEKRPRRRATEPIGAAGDKNARHWSSLPSRNAGDILCVGDVLHPLDVLAIRSFLNGDVRHGIRW